MPSEREEAKACVERWQASRKGPQDLVLVLACVVLSKNPSYKATFHRNKEGGCHLTIDLPSSTVAPMRDEIPWSDSKEKRETRKVDTVRHQTMKKKRKKREEAYEDESQDEDEETEKEKVNDEKTEEEKGKRTEEEEEDEDEDENDGSQDDEGKDEETDKEEINEETKEEKGKRTEKTEEEDDDDGSQDDEDEGEGEETDKEEINEEKEEANDEKTEEEEAQRKKKTVEEREKGKDCEQNEEDVAEKARANEEEEEEAEEEKRKKEKEERCRKEDGDGEREYQPITQDIQASEDRKIFTPSQPSQLLTPSTFDTMQSLSPTSTPIKTASTTLALSVKAPQSVRKKKEFDPKKIESFYKDDYESVRQFVKDWKPCESENFLLFRSLDQPVMETANGELSSMECIKKIAELSRRGKNLKGAAWDNDCCLSLYVFHLHCLVKNKSSPKYNQWKDVENDSEIRDSVGKTTKLNQLRVLGELFCKHPGMLFPTGKVKRYPKRSTLYKYAMHIKKASCSMQAYSWWKVHSEPEAWSERTLKSILSASTAELLRLLDLSQPPIVGDGNKPRAPGSPTTLDSAKVEFRLSEISPNRPSPLTSVSVLDYQQSKDREIITVEDDTCPAAIDNGDVVLRYQQVVISKADLERLEPKQFLNDTLVQFYLEYLINQFPKESPSNVHVFNPFFFTKLIQCKQEKDFEELQKWTKTVDLFAKRLIFIPVHQKSSSGVDHWNLIVVCNLDALFARANPTMEERRTEILFLDSLNSLKSRDCDDRATWVIEFLHWEWKKKRLDKEGAELFRRKNMPPRCPSVPEQKNGYDCGMYVLLYVEYLLNNPPLKESDFSRCWFNGSDVDEKRTEIKQLVYRLAKKEKEREKAEHTASPPKRKHSDEENDGTVRSDEKKLATSGTEEASQKVMVDEPNISTSKHQSKRRKVATVQEPTDERGMMSSTLTACKKALKDLIDHRYSSPFREAREGHFEKIKRPMDLCTVQDNLSKGAYANVEAFKEDLELLWENTKSFYGPDHELTKRATTLSMYFKRLFKKVEKTMK